jgi:hypothetical protein
MASKAGVVRLRPEHDQVGLAERLAARRRAADLTTEPLIVSKPEKIVTDAIYAAVGSPEYVARVIVEDLRSAGYLPARGGNP